MFDKQFEMRYFEMNNFGEATPITMVTLLEEAASEHCDAINHNLFQLSQQNIGWVLISGFMRMNRYPVYKEKITIRTWISGYTSTRGYRENIILDEKHNIIGRAKGLWLFYDVMKRKPKKIFETIQDKWPCFPAQSMGYDIDKKIAPITTGKYENRFKVHKYDIDAYNHVNNLRYLQWVLETIPTDIEKSHFLHSIEARFINEAHYAHEVASLTEHDELTNLFSHTIKDITENYTCSIGNSSWKKRVA